MKESWTNSQFLFCFTRMASVFSAAFMADLGLPHHIDHPLEDMSIEEMERLLEDFKLFVEAQLKASDCDGKYHHQWELVQRQLQRFVAAKKHTTEEQVAIENNEYAQEGFKLSAAENILQLITQGQTAACLEERFRTNSLELPEDSEKNKMYKFFEYLMWELTNTVRKVCSNVLVELPSLQEAKESETKRPRKEA